LKANYNISQCKLAQNFTNQKVTQYSCLVNNELEDSAWHISAGSSGRICGERVPFQLCKGS